MKRNVRCSKYEPLVDEVELLSANPQYAHVRLPNGNETTVSLRQLAPMGDTFESPSAPGPVASESNNVDTAQPTECSCVESPASLESRVPENTPEADLQSPDVTPPPSTALPDDEPPPSNVTEGPFVRTRPYFLRSCTK